MLEWTETKTELPPEHVMVMGKWAIKGGGKKFEAVEYLGEGRWMYSQDGDAPTRAPTHWAPFNDC